MNMLDVLIEDILLIITVYLNNEEKINFLSSSRDLHNLKNKIYYEDIINVKNIYELWYFDRFKNIIIDNLEYKLPKSLNQLTFCETFNNNIKEYIPDSVSHLTFGNDFNQDIQDCIPNSITHLTFGHCFNKNINGCIPSSVTQLTFGACFDRNIKGCIPNSVTHLIFGDCFNKNISNCIPPSVTHLTLGTHFEQDLSRCISNSVTTSLVHLTFCYHIKSNKSMKEWIPTQIYNLFHKRDYIENINNCLPQSIKRLTLIYHYSNYYYEWCVHDNVLTAKKIKQKIKQKN